MDMHAQEVLDAAEGPHLLLYTSRREAQHGRRSLAEAAAQPLTGFGAYTECGQLCQAQVGGRGRVCYLDPDPSDS